MGNETFYGDGLRRDKDTDKHWSGPATGRHICQKDRRLRDRSLRGGKMRDPGKEVVMPVICHPQML